MTLTFSRTNLHLLIKTTQFTIFMPKSSKLSMKSYVLAFYHIWPHRKKGQGQPKVIICIFLVVLSYLMLHTKFQGHPSVNSGEEDFFKVFTIYGHGSHLGHVTLFICIRFHSHSSVSFHEKFGSKWLNSFREKQVKILKSEWPMAKIK